MDFFYFQMKTYNVTHLQNHVGNAISIRGKMVCIYGKQTETVFKLPSNPKISGTMDAIVYHTENTVNLTLEYATG